LFVDTLKITEHKKFRRHKNNRIQKPIHKASHRSTRGKYTEFLNKRKDIKSLLATWKIILKSKTIRKTQEANNFKSTTIPLLQSFQCTFLYAHH